MLLEGDDGYWYFTEVAGTFPDKTSAHINYEKACKYNELDEYLKKLIKSTKQDGLKSDISTIRLYGDYTKSIELAEAYYNGDIDFGLYNLLNNNCKTYVQIILSAGKNYSDIMQTIIMSDITPIPIIYIKILAAAAMFFTKKSPKRQKTNNKHTTNNNFITF